MECMANKGCGCVVLYGGSFDPVHRGHIEVAEAACERIGADAVYMIPARRSPFKEENPVASNDDRARMLELAVEGRGDFFVSRAEFERAEPSYSYDTVKHFRQMLGDSVELVWLIGADMLESLKDWYRIGDMLKICRVAVMCRGGNEVFDDARLAGFIGDELAGGGRVFSVETPLIDISSTAIRETLRAGGDVSDMLDARVLEYIRKKGLYRG